MNSNDSEREERTNPIFDELLDEQGHLPDVMEADELNSRLCRAIFGEESSYNISKVVLTYRPARGGDYKRLENRTRAGGLQYGRVKPTVGFQEFWHPVLAPIPVVAFKINEKSGHTEWWTETVHPRLVAAGREAVMRHMAKWLFHEIHEVTAHLTQLLEFLAVTREEETISTRWPVEMHTEPGEEWDVDPDDRVPAIDDEDELQTAKKRFPHLHPDPGAE